MGVPAPACHRGPLPACGATRAFVLFVHGDLAFVRYNWAWLVLWAALLAWSALPLARSLRGRALTGPWSRRVGAFLQRSPPAVVALPLLLMVLSWLVAVANLGWIRN